VPSGQRLTGTLEVVLLCHADTDTLSVRVHDPNGGGDFEVPVAPAQAMNVFHHPYAYAAARGIEYQLHDETAVRVDV
jgi:hypothetical protein